MSDVISGQVQGRSPVIIQRPNEYLVFVAFSVLKNLLNELCCLPIILTFNPIGFTTASIEQLLHNWRVGNCLQITNPPISKVSFMEGHKQKAILLNLFHPNPQTFITVIAESSVEILDPKFFHLLLESNPNAPSNPRSESALISYSGVVTEKLSPGVYQLDHEYSIACEFMPSTVEIGTMVRIDNVQVHKQTDQQLFYCCPLVSSIVSQDGRHIGAHQMYPASWDNYHLRSTLDGELLQFVNKKLAREATKKLLQLLFHAKFPRHLFFSFFSHFGLYVDTCTYCSAKYSALTLFPLHKHFNDKATTKALEPRGYNSIETRLINCTELLIGMAKTLPDTGQTYFHNIDGTKLILSSDLPISSNHGSLVVLEQASLVNEVVSGTVFTYLQANRVIQVESFEAKPLFALEQSSSKHIGIIQKVVDPSLVEISKKGDLVKMQGLLEIILIGEISNLSLQPKVKIKPCKNSILTIPISMATFLEIRPSAGIFVLVEDCKDRNRCYPLDIVLDSTLEHGNALVNGLRLTVSKLVGQYLSSICKKNALLYAPTLCNVSEILDNAGLAVCSFIGIIKKKSMWRGSFGGMSFSSQLSESQIKNLFTQHNIGLPTARAFLKLKIVDMVDGYTMLDLLLDIGGRQSYPIGLYQGRVATCFNFKRAYIDDGHGYKQQVFVSLSASRIESRPKCDLTQYDLDKVLFVFLSDHFGLGRQNSSIAKRMVTSKCRIIKILSFTLQILCPECFEPLVKERCLLHGRRHGMVDICILFSASDGTSEALFLVDDFELATKIFLFDQNDIMKMFRLANELEDRLENNIAWHRVIDDCRYLARLWRFVYKFYATVDEHGQCRVNNDGVADEPVLRKFKANSLVIHTYGWATQPLFMVEDVEQVNAKAECIKLIRIIDEYYNLSTTVK